MTPLSVTAAHVQTARVWRRRAILCAIVALCSWEAAAQDRQEPDRQKTVLALYSTRRGTPSAVLLDAALERTLGTGLAGRLDFHVEYIDLARFTEPGYQQSLRDFLRAKYAQYKFDLVITTSDYDLDFATRYRDDLFPGVPLVFSSSPGSSPVPNATGAVSELNLRDTVRIATTIQPDVRRVVVVSGASAIDKTYEAVARDQFKVFEGRLVFTYLSGLPLSELLRQVAQLPADAILYYLVVFEDGNGDKFVGVDGLERIAAVANATDLHLAHLRAGPRNRRRQPHKHGGPGPTAGRTGVAGARRRKGRRHRRHRIRSKRRRIRLAPAPALADRRASLAVGQRRPIPSAYDVGTVQGLHHHGRCGTGAPDDVHRRAPLSASQTATGRSGAASEPAALCAGNGGGRCRRLGLEPGYQRNVRGPAAQAAPRLPRR